VQVVRSTRSERGTAKVQREGGKTFVKRLLYLAVAALVAMLILVPTAMAQEMTAEVKQEMTVEKDLPKSGGVGPGTLVLPAGALLLGAGVLGYAVLRRR
jgi:hypothetical protein